ncbi:PhoX family phosphatase [Solimonas sp. SE-A11]|uniref:PhoX family protein n=1 Tax=Solimonas sp. SE-A11 TaxID=3054954 RepID=UPI00259D0BCC|nr:PhoX family phosphatase [Solimonas sp. SE-A11]MDM4771762.1 PhoX family phosphatase [Solimonas sp. SE-A11]
MKATDADDVSSNPSANLHLNQVAAMIYSRRDVLKAGLAFGAVGFFGAGLSACDRSDAYPLLGFKSVAANSGDDVVVPEGYRHAVLCRWGDPLFADSPAWKGDASENAAAQVMQFGDNNDGMRFFPLGAGNSREGLLVMNHEYINPEYFFTPDVQSGDTPWSQDHVRKSQHAHGVSVAQVQRQADGSWQVVVGAPCNRRIHANTAMELTGPVRGHTQVRTTASPTGEGSLGTINNCGNGYTPWGTYLTCEENFNNYFGTTGGEDTRSPLMRRYGVSAAASEYRWEEHDERFDYAKEPNESNRFGWIVEIDPFEPSSTPKKRTAMGRFKHENAALRLAADRRVVVYMGDDQADDYLYKFVSDAAHDPALSDAGNKARNLLESGTLYVAKFGAGAASGDMMGDGQWIPLRLDTPAVAGGTLGDLYPDMGALLVSTRLAADAAGATRMDRPEWVAVHPKTGEVYCTLTNNSGRSSTDDVNPRQKNVYGQIVRWREAGGDAAAERFEWDLFVLAGNPTAHDAGTLEAGSSNVNADNMFNSPDGLSFDADGRLWIETDGKYSNTGDFAGMGNNQMLVADPHSKEIRRFMVGPSACEITGISFTPDQRCVFVNIQHPGEYGGHPNQPETRPEQDPLAFSRWPDNGAGGRPRPATVVIWKADGGKVGT